MCHFVLFQIIIYTYIYTNWTIWCCVSFHLQLVLTQVDRIAYNTSVEFLSATKIVWVTKIQSLTSFICVIFANLLIIFNVPEQWTVFGLFLRLDKQIWCLNRATIWFSTCASDFWFRSSDTFDSFLHSACTQLCIGWNLQWYCSYACTLCHCWGLYAKTSLYSMICHSCIYT